MLVAARSSLSIPGDGDWIADIQEAPEPPRSLARLKPVSGGPSEMF